MWKKNTKYEEHVILFLPVYNFFNSFEKKIHSDRLIDNE